MKRKEHHVLTTISRILGLLSTGALFVVLLFIVWESLPFLQEKGLLALLSPGRWDPVAKQPSFSVVSMILTSLYIFLLSVLFALPLSIGTAFYINFYLPARLKVWAVRFVSILAGIPSVIMGFIGLVIVVKWVEIKFSVASGESVLAAAIVVTMMILPFILNVVDESLSILREEFLFDSEALGISKEYFIRRIALGRLGEAIRIGVILAFSRVIGETMAIMMVIGNAPMMPRLLGKAETIPGLIALEMGMAEAGSLHYSALFSSGLILLLTIMAVNLVIAKKRKKGVADETSVQETE